MMFPNFVDVIAPSPSSKNENSSEIGGKKVIFYIIVTRKSFSCKTSPIIRDLVNIVEAQTKNLCGGLKFSLFQPSNSRLHFISLARTNLCIWRFARRSIVCRPLCCYSASLFGLNEMKLKAREVLS